MGKKFNSYKQDIKYNEMLKTMVWKKVYSESDYLADNNGDDIARIIYKYGSIGGHII